MNSLTKKIRRKGFSLIEVLIAIAILGVGLVMVATIFPVAATWTRQAAEETVASQVALNAVNVIKVKLDQNAFAWNNLVQYNKGSFAICDGQIYISGATNTGDANRPSSGGGTWTAMPGTSAATTAAIANFLPVTYPTYSAATSYPAGSHVRSGGHLYRAIMPSLGQAVTVTDYWLDLGSYTAPSYVFPQIDRAYSFGSDSPYPSAASGSALYYWTAILRPSGSGNEVNVYVFVFRKGAADQTFSTVPTGATEVTGDRSGATETEAPMLVAKSYAPGSLSGNTITGAVPPVGYLGLGLTSGTVFRQGLNADASQAAANPLQIGTEPVVYAPAADNTDGSPLVYIYQAKLTF